MATRTVHVRKHRVTRGGKTHTRRAHTRHLYSVPSQRGAVERSFEARYGKTKGRYVYGATVGKVRREQVKAGKRSPTEKVRKHRARYPKRKGGRRRKGTHPVKAHTAFIGTAL